MSSATCPPAWLSLNDEVRAFDGESPPVTPRFKLLTDLELESLPEAEEVISGIAYADSLAILLGKYGTFKTFLLLEMAFCITVGADWHGRRVKQGSVVYIYAEGAWGLQKRWAALKAAYQFTGSVPIYFLPTSVLLTDPGQVAQLVLAIEALGVCPRAVFVDTVARNMNGDENSVEDMGRFIQGCDAIRETFGALVFLAHHTGWDNDRARGSTALPGAVNTEIIVTRDDILVTLKCTKQKDGPEFPPITLEAFDVAESLAFRAVEQNSPVFTRNERAVFNAVQQNDGISVTAISEMTGLGKGSVFNAKTRLLALAYVKVRANKVTATDAGRLAFGPAVQICLTDVQTARPPLFNAFHPPLGVNAEQDAEQQGELQDESQRELQGEQE